MSSGPPIIYGQEKKQMFFVFNGSTCDIMIRISLSTNYFFSLSLDRKFAALHPDPRIDVCVRYSLSCPCLCVVHSLGFVIYIFNFCRPNRKTLRFIGGRGKRFKLIRLTCTRDNRDVRDLVFQ